MNRLCLTIAFCLFGTPLLAQTAPPPASPPATTIQRSLAISDGRTPGGIRLVHLPLKSEKDQVFSFFWTDRHIQHTPEKAGLMALAPTLVSIGGAGSLDAGAVEEELKDLGGYFGLSRGRSSTTGQISAPVGEFEAVARLMRTALMKPRLPRITLERQKRFLLNNSKASREKAESVAREAIQRIIVGMHPIAATITYTPTSVITDVQVADVDAWRKAVLARRNLTVVAAGPLSREAAATLVDQTFGDLPENDVRMDAVPFKPVALGAKTIVVESPVKQSVILAGAPVNWRAGGEEGAARSIAMSILGASSRSRLFVSIRDRLGAAYGASAGITGILGNESVFTMEASVATDRISAALGAMREEYSLLRAKGVTAEEVEPLKLRMLSGFPDAMRRASSAANVIRNSMQIGQPYDAADRYATTVSSQNAESISRMIAEKLPEALTVIIVTPSAEGLAADCVIKSLDELSRCLAP